MWFHSIILCFVPHNTEATLEKALFPQPIKFILCISNIILLFDFRPGAYALMFSG